MITDDGFWFVLEPTPTGVMYSFYKNNKIIETGEVPTVESVWEPFEAFVARHRQAPA